MSQNCCPSPSGGKTSPKRTLNEPKWLWIIGLIGWILEGWIPGLIGWILELIGWIRGLIGWILELIGWILGLIPSILGLIGS